MTSKYEVSTHVFYCMLPIFVCLSSTSNCSHGSFQVFHRPKKGSSWIALQDFINLLQYHQLEVYSVLLTGSFVWMPNDWELGVEYPLSLVVQIEVALEEEEGLEVKEAVQ